MWTGHLKTAVSSLRESRWRTTFTMLGIIIGISSVVTVVSLGEGLKQQITGQINQLGPNVLTVRPGKLTSTGSLGSLYSFLAPSTLTTSDVASLNHISSVANVAPIEFVTSTVKDDTAEMDNVFVAGTTANLGTILHQKINYGGFFLDQDDPNNFAVIGSSIATKLFGEFNPVGETMHINGEDFVVHGVFTSSTGSLLSLSQADLNSSIFIPTEEAEALTKGRTNILQIFVQAKPHSNIDTVVKQINKTLSKNHNGTNDFTVLKRDQLLGVSDQLIDSATGFISGIAAISLLVGGIGIMNILLVSVSERTREIGIRKAIGATNRQILNQFLAEGLVLSIGGGIIGIGVSFLINLLLRLYSGWKPVISLPILFIAVAVSVAAGVIFSLAPALKAARKDPITALRGN
ncbi:ABC transporter permease [Candidatus Saccharibacteria bacterium]|nr:ABC transporter permease [Candidatus Saccharibacteria bacterium]